VARVTTQCPARSGRAERRTRGCRCRGQEREPAVVGLGSMPVGGPGGRVFAVGREQEWTGAERRAGAGGGPEVGQPLEEPK
jgi:hypothetical protein